MCRNEGGVHVDYYYLGGKLIAKKNGSTVTYLHADYLGSTAAESNTGGTVTARLHYQPFGENIGTPVDDIGYTGHKFDTDLDLSYMEARYYDPVLGRFMANDPVGFISTRPMTFNRYSYGNNNPHKYVDPDGEFGIIGFVIGAAIEAAVQYVITGEIDYKEVLIAGAVGAVTGGVGGSLAKSALTGTISAGRAVATTAVVGGVANAAGTVVEGALDGERATMTEVATSAALGAVGAGVGARIGNSVASGLDALAQSGGGEGYDF